MTTLQGNELARKAYHVKKLKHSKKVEMNKNLFLTFSKAMTVK